MAAISGYFASDLRGRLDRISTLSEVVAKKADNLNHPASDNTQKSNPPYSWEEVDRLWLILQAMQLTRSNKGWRHNKIKAPPPDLTMPLEDAYRWLSKQGIDIATHPSFDELAYLRDNPDVRKAVQSGEVSSGYAHYLMSGRFEVRPPIRRRR
jgi:hypothetical protein